MSKSFAIKKEHRIRRCKKTRSKLRELSVTRLSVHRTPKHIYAQIIGADGNVLASASSLDKNIKKDKDSGKIGVAKAVGKLVALKAKEKGVLKVGFDRSGFKYHGRIKALADAAREGGLDY